MPWLARKRDLHAPRLLTIANELICSGIEFWDRHLHPRDLGNAAFSLKLLPVESVLKLYERILDRHLVSLLVIEARPLHRCAFGDAELALCEDVLPCVYHHRSLSLRADLCIGLLEREFGAWAAVKLVPGT